MSKLDQHMDKSLQDLSEKIKGLRTNRANPGMIKNIQVNYYGSIVPLQQVASISTPDASQFSLNVFDQNAVKIFPHQAVKLLQDVGFEIKLIHYLFIFPRFLKILRPFERLALRVPFGCQYLVLAQKH